ncbi:MAG: hypothetical protein KKH72_03740 [Alphaproteobacteria bacterium]|nr:hypothetical protein [Alphaproteobacteria bacterium]
MNTLKRLAAALLFVAASSGPALAQWDYGIETDVTGLEYAKVSAKDTSGAASIYTECTRGVGMGLAVILRADETMIETHGGQTGQILYMSDKGGEALASVDYAPGEGVLTLITPDRATIVPVWELIAAAGQTISVRFTLPPFPQVFEVVFSAEGAAEAIGSLGAYCE